MRPALPEDAETVRDILQASFGEYQSLLKLASPPAALTDTLEDVTRGIEEQTVFLAIYNRMKPVGSIRIKLLPGGIAYISRFAVMPNWQQSGAGKALMEAVVEHCRAHGVKAIALHTAVKLISLARFYLGCGFYVHSVELTPSGYRRGLFIKELEDCDGMAFDSIKY